MKFHYGLNTKTALKYIIFVGLLLSTLCGCSSHSYNGSPEQEAIYSVLEQLNDISTDDPDEYLYALGSISLYGCPDDFISAFTEYYNAWSALAALIDEVQAYDERYNSGSAFVESFIRGFCFDFSMVGEANDARSSLLVQASNVERAMRDSAVQMLNIAEMHNVDTSSYR